MEDVVLDQRVQLPLVEVGLELGARSQLVQIQEHQVWIESRPSIWRRTAELGLRVEPLPAAEGLHVGLGLLRGHADGLLATLHLLDDVVQVADIVLDNALPLESKPQRANSVLIRYRLLKFQIARIILEYGIV